MPTPACLRFRILPILGAALLTVLAAPRAGFAQCGDWINGPLPDRIGGTDGPVYAMTAWDPDGTGPAPEYLVVGGDFTTVGGITASNIAFFDGSLWWPMGTGTDGPVRALTVYNNQLVAGGSFTTAGGVSTDHTALWNGSGWTAMNGGGVATVYALAVHNGQLYAGGNFYHYMRRWDAPSSYWVDLAVPLDGPVYALKSHQPDYGTAYYLYAGGSFTHAGTASTPHVAGWDGAQWHDIVGGLDGTVYAFTEYNGSLIAGGEFLHSGSKPDPDEYVAAWDGVAWGQVGGSLGGTVLALGVTGSRLVAGGTFLNAGISGDAQREAEFDLYIGWESVGGGIGAATPDGEAVRAIATFGSSLAVGGQFTSAGSASIDNLAVTGNNRPWEDLVPSSHVRALAVYGTKLALGGVCQETLAGGDTRYLVSWDGTDVAGMGGGPGGPVDALTGYGDSSFPYASHLVVGGEFETVGGLSAHHVALWTESPSYPFNHWSALGNGLNGTVHVLDRLNGKIVAGGDFTASGLVSTPYVARYDGSAWQSMGSGMNGPVYALKSYRSGISNYLLIAAGDFTIANGVAANRVAYWTTSTIAPETPWRALGNGFNARVYALERYNNSLYAGGEFTFAGSNLVSYVARWTGSDWVAVGSGLSAPVRALLAEGGYLYAAGDFTTVHNGPGEHVARWDGTAWSAAGSGLDSVVVALAAFHTEVVAGQDFTWESGDVPGYVGVSRFPETGVPWVARSPLSQGVDAGQNASFTVEAASGYTGVGYRWRRNGAPLADGPTGNGSTISGSGTATVTVTAAAEADAGSYDCLLTNGCGTDSSGVADLTVNPVTGVGDLPGTGPGLALAIWPNPSAGPLSIEFSMAHGGRASVRVFDAAGRLVRRLSDADPGPGRERIRWDGRDEAGRAAPSGIYYLTVRTSETSASRKVVLVK